jgi:hypothetical protein
LAVSAANTTATSGGPIVAKKVVNAMTAVSIMTVTVDDDRDHEHPLQLLLR